MSLPTILHRRGPSPSLGQSLVEYAITVPVFMLMLLGMLELGFAFSHHLTMEYASREGARAGAALANGTDDFPCGNVDNMVVAAVERVLTAAGSQVAIGEIDTIRIYKSNLSGGEAGPVNVWGPGFTAQNGNAPALQFQVQSAGWNACTRKNDRTGGTDPDSIGVRLHYTYAYVTPLGALMGATGNPTIQMSDKTIMALNPDSD